MMKPYVCMDSSARSEVLGGLLEVHSPQQRVRGRGEGSKHQAWPEQRGVISMARAERSAGRCRKQHCEIKEHCSMSCETWRLVGKLTEGGNAFSRAGLRTVCSDRAQSHSKGHSSDKVSHTGGNW